MQGRARQLEKIAGRHIDRIAALEAEVSSLQQRVASLEAGRALLAGQLRDSERAFEHSVSRREDREQTVRAHLKRIRELELLLAQRTKDLARAERAVRG